MLKLVLVAALSLSGSAFAKTFNYEVESLMVEAALEKCTLPTDANFKLESVSIQEIAVDQGLHDYVYTAVFAVTYLGNDEQTIVNKQVRVKVKKYQVSNPAFNPYELLSVTSTDARICN